MDLGGVEQEILRKYKPALVAIGVDFSDWEVIQAIECCTYELESKFQAVIGWYVWLMGKHQDEKNWKDRLPHFTYILVRAFREQWQPVVWEDEFLTIACSQSDSGSMRRKLQDLEFFRYVSYEIKDNSEYVHFFQNGRMVWQLAVEDGLMMSAEELTLMYAKKTSTSMASLEDSRY